MTTTFTKFFAEIGKDDAGIAGGKGASLGEMTQAGINVPEGFVLLAEAFDTFIAETDLNVEIEAVLSTVKHEEMHTVEHASEKIQAGILRAKMPADIADDVLENFRTLGSEFVAVRSSATAEDSISSAWAGQLDTYLNTKEADLITNVQKCWASLFTPRAIFYRFEKGLHTTKISVAVVVQKMVNSDSAGIAFSVHPVTEDYNQIIIEAGFGLGEAVVSGQVTPDSYVVTKVPRQIIDKNISEQEKGLFRKSGGGNEWKELGTAGHAQVLSDEQILELSELVIGIETHYSFPCDIEWAMEDGKIYITQSRPITTLTFKIGVNNKKISLVDEITKLVWFKSWEAKFPLFLVTMGAPGYFKPMKLTFGFELGHFLVITHKGVLAGFWVEDELIGFGTHLTTLAEKDESVLSIWSTRLKEETDICRALMRKGKEYFLTLEHFRELRQSDEVLSAYQIAIREVINYLPDVLREKYRQELEEARKYSETIFFELSELVTSLLEYVAIKEDVSVESMGCITGDELEAYFAGSTLPDSLILKERYTRSGFIKHPDFSWLSANDIDTIEQSFVKNISDEVKGQVAYKGKVTGVVRVVKDFSTIGEFIRGSILVTGMTDPNYVPIMEKAGAIVTDAGGMLCHAAIVAREMKKPCVIGTRIATKVFTDGDMVEVDADRGVVRKI